MKDYELLDELLIEAAGEVSLAETDVLRVNPWRKPIHLMLWGIALQTITIGFLWFQFILPAAGTALFYCGVRSLRKVNRWFTALWIFGSIDLAAELAHLIWSCLPESAANALPVFLYMTQLVYSMAKLWVFHQGLQWVYRFAQIPMEKKPLLWAMVWYFLVGMIGLFISEIGFAAAALLLVFAVFLWHQLYSVSDELAQAGYLFRNAPVGLSMRAVMISYLCLCVAGVACGGFYSNHFAVMGESETASCTAHRELREDLAGAGFPEEILADIEDADVLRLAGAKRVTVKRDKEERDPEVPWIHGETILVEMTRSHFYVITYFSFANHKLYGNNGFNIESSYDGAKAWNPISGKLLFSEDGKNMVSDMTDFGMRDAQSLDWFGAGVSFKRIEGNVVYPFGTENQRGYVMYEKEISPDAYHAEAVVFNFCWGGLPVSLPYKSRAERLDNLFSNQRYQSYCRFDVNSPEEGLLGERD